MAFPNQLRFDSASVCGFEAEGGICSKSNLCDEPRYAVTYAIRRWSVKCQPTAVWPSWCMLLISAKNAMVRERKIERLT